MDFFSPERNRPIDEEYEGDEDQTKLETPTLYTQPQSTREQEDTVLNYSDVLTDE